MWNHFSEQATDVRDVSKEPLNARSFLEKEIIWALQERSQVKETLSTLRAEERFEVFAFEEYVVLGKLSRVDRLRNWDFESLKTTIFSLPQLEIGGRSEVNYKASLKTITISCWICMSSIKLEIVLKVEDQRIRVDWK